MNNEIRHDPDGGFTVIPIDARDSDTGGKITIGRDVLERIVEVLNCTGTSRGTDQYDDEVSAMVEIENIIERQIKALAQPQQEPVARYIGESWEGSLVQLYEDVAKETELYASPPARKPLTDGQVIRGAEAVSEALRKLGMEVSDQDLDATEKEQAIAEYVYLAMQEAAHGITS